MYVLKSEESVSSFYEISKDQPNTEAATLHLVAADRSTQLRHCRPTAAHQTFLDEQEPGEPNMARNRQNSPLNRRRVKLALRPSKSHITRKRTWCNIKAAITVGTLNAINKHNRQGCSGNKGQTSLITQTAGNSVFFCKRK